MELKNKNKASCLAVFGTGSEVGKSVITAALCRFFARKGIKTAPFKAQNMSNNSGVTPEGLEIGRAQIVQAEASKIPPNVDMNPILLKPTGEKSSQIVLLGKAIENCSACEYYKKKDQLFEIACSAFDRLQNKFSVIVMEGAGSCAEVNLMAHDIVNFRMAEYANAKVILVADIHKGGVFAQIVGTLECLSQKQRNRIAGFIINRFKGDLSLFDNGIRWIEKKTKKKVFGVLPWYNHINIEAEDSVAIENLPKISTEKIKSLAIAVIRLPRISNFTDFAPLSQTKINLYFIEKPQDLSPFKAVILPGSKNTRSDLDWLHNSGWSKRLAEYAKRKGKILGICGGYQMLGNFVQDLDGVEGTLGVTQGLSLLPIATFLKSPKTTSITKFEWNNIEGVGYEIHTGQTKREKGKPMFHVFERNGILCNTEDGCISDDSNIMGTYMHGLFDAPDITKLWLKTIGIDNVENLTTCGIVARNEQYDLLADHFEKYINIQEIQNVIKN